MNCHWPTLVSGSRHSGLPHGPWRGPRAISASQWGRRAARQTNGRKTGRAGAGSEPGVGGECGDSGCVLRHEREANAGGGEWRGERGRQTIYYMEQAKVLATALFTRKSGKYGLSHLAINPPQSNQNLRGQAKEIPFPETSSGWADPMHTQNNELRHTLGPGQDLASRTPPTPPTPT